MSARRPWLSRFYVLLPLLVVALTGFEVLLSYAPFASAVTENSAEFQKKQVDSFMEMNKLLIEIATLSIGGITAFVLHRDKDVKLNGAQLRRVIASWTLCAASLYFGYLSYQQATLELSYGFFDYSNPLLRWPARAQFWTFLSSVAVFADFIYGTLETVQTRRYHP
jgi:hypothetical protein